MGPKGEPHTKSREEDEVSESRLQATHTQIHTAREGAIEKASVGPLERRGDAARDKQTPETEMMHKDTHTEQRMRERERKRKG